MSELHSVRHDLHPSEEPLWATEIEIRQERERKFEPVWATEDEAELSRIFGIAYSDE